MPRLNNCVCLYMYPPPPPSCGHIWLQRRQGRWAVLPGGRHHLCGEEERGWLVWGCNEWRNHWAVPWKLCGSHHALRGLTDQLLMKRRSTTLWASEPLTESKRYWVHHNPQACMCVLLHASHFNYYVFLLFLDIGLLISGVCMVGKDSFWSYVCVSMYVCMCMRALCCICLWCQKCEVTETWNSLFT